MILSHLLSALMSAILMLPLPGPSVTDPFSTRSASNGVTRLSCKVLKQAEAGKSVPLELTLSNDGPDALLIFEVNGWPVQDCRLTVTGENGLAVNPTAQGAGRLKIVRGGVSGAFAEIESRAHRTWKLDLNETFFLKPGTYHIDLLLRTWTDGHEKQLFIRFKDLPFKVTAPPSGK